jgi:predicted NUDIX family phosphoesterase
MSNPKWDEQILVVKRKTVFGDNDFFEGILTNSEKVEVIANRFEDFSVMRRGNEKDPTPMENNAEINLEYKQPIPYIVFRRDQEFFVYKRLSGGGESRLFDKLSIGAGGHMNYVEGASSFAEQVWENMLREIEEELEVDSSSVHFETLGLLNDEQDEVGNVHIGIVLIANIEPDGDIKVNETDQLRGEWMTLDQLTAPRTYDKLENWSKIVVSELYSMTKED